jgi:hypothetical protein
MVVNFNPFFQRLSRMLHANLFKSFSFSGIFVTLYIYYSLIYIFFQQTVKFLNFVKQIDFICHCALFLTLITT